MKVAALLAPFALVAVGCSSNEASSSANTGLKPAAEVAAADALPLGEVVDINETSRFTVSAIEVHGNAEGAWLSATVRGEAPDAAGVLPADAGIRCADSTGTGGYLASSTLSLADPIPAGSFLDGTLDLLLPGDGRYGEPIPTCTTPAVIRVGEAGSEFLFQLPDSVVAELNAAGAAFNATLTT